MFLKVEAVVGLLRQCFGDAIEMIYEMWLKSSCSDCYQVLAMVGKYVRISLWTPPPFVAPSFVSGWHGSWFTCVVSQFQIVMHEMERKQECVSIKFCVSSDKLDRDCWTNEGDLWGQLWVIFKYSAKLKMLENHSKIILFLVIHHLALMITMLPRFEIMFMTIRDGQWTKFNILRC